MSRIKKISFESLQHCCGYKLTYKHGSTLLKIQDIDLYMPKSKLVNRPVSFTTRSSVLQVYQINNSTKTIDNVSKGKYRMSLDTFPSKYPRGFMLFLRQTD